MTGIRTVVVVVVAALGVSAQEGPARALARALELEEAAGEPARALEAYQELLADEEAEAPLRFRAGLGALRCLRGLGRTDAAQALVPRVRALAKGDPERLARLGAEVARIKSGPQEEPLGARVRELLRQGELEQIVDLGEPAVPVLKTLAEDASRPALEALLRLGTPPARDAVVALITERKVADRAAIVRRVANKGEAEVARVWRPVAVAALQDPDPVVRRAAAKSLLPHVPGVPVETWRRLLDDGSGPVRAAVLSSLTKAYGLPDAMVADAFQDALEDPYVPVRRTAVRIVDVVVKPRSPEMAHEILRRASRDADPGVRLDALRGRLGSMPPEERRGILMDRLDDPDARVRQKALQLLRGVVTVEDVPRIRPLLRDSSGGVRSAAAGALSPLEASAVCSGPDAEELLVACLSDPYKSGRTTALSFLARAGSPSVFDHVVPFLQSRDNGERAAALYFVIRHDRIDAFPRVLEALPDLGVSHTLWLPEDGPVHVLGKKGVIAWLRKRRDVDALLSLLRRIDGFGQGDLIQLAKVVHGIAGERRREVFDAIVAAGAPEPTAGLIQRLTHFFGDAAWALDGYMSLLDSESHALRWACAQALRSVGGPEQVPALVAALEEEGHERTADVLVDAVAAHARAEHVELVADALSRAEKVDVKRQLVTALARIGTDAAVDVLIARLREDDPLTGHVISLLGGAGVTRVVPTLHELLSTDALDAYRRAQALVALGRLGDAESVPVILDAVRRHEDRLEDSRFRVMGHDGKEERYRHVAGLTALHDLGPTHLLAAGRRILDEEGWSEGVRASLMRILAFVPDPGADAMILEGLEHPAAAVREGAARAAGQALLTNGRDRLRRLVRDTDLSVRRAATDALRRLVELGAL